MKAHKYWSAGALITMIGSFYTGYKGLKSSHKYFALSSILCMTMAMHTGHKMISGNRKKMANKEKVTEREEYIMLEVGVKAPDFELPDPNGKIHRLSDYTGKKSNIIFLSQG